MEKISAKEFFTVMWSGVCQVLEWFFGLFGYRRDGKFAKCVWGLFATSAAVVMVIIAGVVVYAGGDELYRWYKRHYSLCDDTSCYENTLICRDIYFHNHEDGKGYIYNIRTGEKYVKNIVWIAKPLGEDSLVVFSNGKKRGYFSKYTGRLVIEPKYNHAWVFSEGLAGVEENGYVKFIDGTGQVVFDPRIVYNSDASSYVFHGGYCVVNSEDGCTCGLIDRMGKIVLPMEYSYIFPTNDYKFWRLEQGEKSALIDKDLNPIVPLSYCSIYLYDREIDVTMPDHTMRKLDTDGNLIDDFYICGVRMLQYDKDEILYRTRTHDDDGDEYAVPFVESYHPQAVARLRSYVAGDGYEGLMTQEGHVLTMPLYRNIDAIAYDLYLCEVSNGDKVIVNGKGEIVR